MGRMWKRWKVPTIISFILVFYMVGSMFIPYYIRIENDYPPWVYLNGLGSICIVGIGIPLAFIVTIFLDRKITKKKNEKHREFGKHKCSRCGYPIFPDPGERPKVLKCPKCGNPELFEDVTPILSIQKNDQVTSPQTCKRCHFTWTVGMTPGSKIKCPKCKLERIVEGKPGKKIFIDMDPDDESEMYAHEEQESFHSRVDFDTANRNSVYVKAIICPDCGHHSTVTYRGQVSTDCEECRLTLKFADRKALLFMK